MMQIKSVLLKIMLGCFFWFSAVVYAQDSDSYDRSTPEAALHSLLDATKRGDFKAMVASYDLQFIFESDPKLKRMQLNAEQQQEFLVQMEGKIQPSLQEMKAHIESKGGVKEFYIDSQSEGVDGIVTVGVTLFYNNGEEEFSLKAVKMINRDGVYKMIPPL